MQFQMGCHAYFKGDLFHLTSSFNPLNESVHIETSRINKEISDKKQISTKCFNIIKKCKNGYFEKCIFKQN